MELNVNKVRGQNRQFLTTNQPEHVALVCLDIEFEGTPLYFCCIGSSRKELLIKPVGKVRKESWKQEKKERLPAYQVVKFL